MKTNPYPVSPKYYSRLCERIDAVIATLGVAAECRSQALSTLRDYLLTGHLAIDASPALHQIIILTLKAEIDAAIERSRRARARAALRRRSLVAVDKAVEQASVTTPGLPDAGLRAVDHAKTPDGSASRPPRALSQSPSGHGRPLGRTRYNLRKKSVAAGRRDVRHPHPYGGIRQSRQ